MPIYLSYKYKKLDFLLKKFEKIAIAKSGYYGIGFTNELENEMISTEFKIKQMLYGVNEKIIKKRKTIKDIELEKRGSIYRSIKKRWLAEAHSSNVKLNHDKKYVK